MNHLHVDVVSATQAWDELRIPWDEIVAMHGSRISDFDVTNSLDWSRTIWEIHLDSAEIQVIVVRHGNEVLGIMPLHRQKRLIRRIPVRSIAPVTQLYCGRPGFVLRRPSPSVLATMFQHLQDNQGTWDVMNLTLVRGSPDENLFLELVSRNHWTVHTIGEHVSPYIVLQESWQQQLAALPKKFRYQLRTGEKRLRDRGDLSYRECVTPGDVDFFNAAVGDIERDSWKESAGTSLTMNPIQDRFHRLMMERAAARGILSGHLLLLDGRPIAYLMGLLHNGVFLDLKSSYRSIYREASPSHVLKVFVFPRLYERQTKIFDFMGDCADFKMLWTDETYRRVDYLLFNNTLRGRAARWLQRLRTPPRAGSTPG